MQTKPESWRSDIIPHIRWKIIVPNSCESPDGYGTAWQLWQMNARVCMPVPLNLIAGAIRATWHWFKRGFYASGHSPRYAEAMAWGEVRGYAFGLEHGRLDAEAAMRTNTTRVDAAALTSLAGRIEPQYIASAARITPASIDDLKRIQRKHRGGR